MYCNKCGGEIPDSCDFCQKCGAPRVRPEQQINDAQRANKAYVPGRNFFGNFGGLIISGALIVLLLIVGTMGIRMFISSQNIVNVFRQSVVILPIGFAAALTIRTKGLDLSLPAMISLSSVILATVDALAVGILISLIACILIGSINAAAVHFLKLPAILVTFVTMLIVSIPATWIGRGIIPRSMNIVPVWMTVTVFAAIMIALVLAFLTSATVNPKKQFWVSVFPVYAGSGIFAVLYSITLLVRLQVATFLPLNIIPIIFIGIFMVIARFHKNKVLGIVFSIVPVLLYSLLGNVLNLTNVSSYWQNNLFTFIIVGMALLIIYRSRSVLTNSVEKKRTWIVLTPLIIYILVQIVFVVGVAVTNGQVSPMYYYLISGVSPVALLLAVVGFYLWYALSKPRHIF